MSAPADLQKICPVARCGTQTLCGRAVPPVEEFVPGAKVELMPELDRQTRHLCPDCHQRPEAFRGYTPELRELTVERLKAEAAQREAWEREAAESGSP